ncbi:2-keto-4-pentenoate hydratase/2-oxohepta-3-ene-1,7-dioic acid hydratase in catechol pathway [Halorubrum alkaliphilum]|uniref:2-keto-4-pentenoate hydratase/2-oxohepta-3-ene-1,7-dioic acid hydratase in catechol pathway n=1 Tax=Halorubrum alkaliphilum TaxID=261290 RepID=A0A8T4GE05_9EURY|nr:fumarylacetoacetate hydrolase family protein [Halorubrum alkaliphilum]MBP1921977.1 2-keto-4-pentenoate hydratase/2-oxohepta-3-ene-1,7-dioic acid hydratase in catechol pathway [Halorubrum alkaliphilum]
MRLARLLTSSGPISGRYEDGVITTDEGRYEVGRDGRLLPPCKPSALYCVGRNYAETLDQMAYERPEEPDFFIKPPASLLAHGQPIRYPDWTEELTYAGELVAVIDERCRELDPADVSDVVRGYTVLNDVDALDQQGRTARKAFDGSAPLGPWIETDVDPFDIEMSTTVGGETRQEANTELMLFGPHEVVSYLSRRFTLRPGDCIAFGSPANPGLVEPGESVEITYEGVGTLSNRVSTAPVPE